MKSPSLWRQLLLTVTARSSADYWQRRYAAGGSSGHGSYGVLAQFKAQVLNDFVAAENIASVIEFGCGDGAQLERARYPRYLGLDVSQTSIDLCARRFAHDSSKSFLWYDPRRTINLAQFLRAELTLSLDVIYHLLEDEVYAAYLRDLFGVSSRYVAIYSSDRMDKTLVRHVRHRKFTDDVAQRFPEFRFVEKIENPHRDQSFADFYFYERR